MRVSGRKCIYICELNECLHCKAMDEIPRWFSFFQETSLEMLSNRNPDRTSQYDECKWYALFLCSSSKWEKSAIFKSYGKTLYQHWLAQNSHLHISELFIWLFIQTKYTDTEPFDRVPPSMFSMISWVCMACVWVFVCMSNMSRVVWHLLCQKNIFIFTSLACRSLNTIANTLAQSQHWVKYECLIPLASLCLVV